MAHLHLIVLSSSTLEKLFSLGQVDRQRVEFEAEKLYSCSETDFQQRPVEFVCLLPLLVD